MSHEKKSLLRAKDTRDETTLEKGHCLTRVHSSAIRIGFFDKGHELIPGAGVLLPDLLHTISNKVFNPLGKASTKVVKQHTRKQSFRCS